MQYQPIYQGLPLLHDIVMMSLVKAYCSVVVDKGGWLDCHFRYVRRQTFLSVCVVCVVCVVCMGETKQHEVCAYCHDDKHTRLTSFHWSSL